MNRIAAALAPALVALAGAPGTALAHGPDAIFDPLTMDVHTPVSKLDVDFAYVAYDTPEGLDLTVFGFALSGQYMTPRGFGGYLTVPLSYLSVESTVTLPPPLPPITSSDSELAIGNVELGGAFSKYLTAHAAIVLHAGVALPTAADEGTAASQVLAAAPRYGDFVQRVPDSTWLRIGVSPMGRAGKLFWRADVGLDLALDEDPAAEISPVFRINVGGGLDLRTAHLLVELVTSVTNREAGDESASTLALGARFLSGNLRPGVALLLPIGFDEAVLEPDFAIALSLAARL